MENSPAAARARRSFFGVARPTLGLTAGAGSHPRARRRSGGPIDAAAAAPPPAAHLGLIHANASRYSYIAHQCFMPRTACNRAVSRVRSAQFLPSCVHTAAASLTHWCGNLLMCGCARESALCLIALLKHARAPTCSPAYARSPLVLFTRR
jgi:hypothetical protein